MLLLVVCAIAAAVQFLGPGESRLFARDVCMVVGLLALVLIWSVRCPSCRRSIGFSSFKTQSPVGWQQALSAVEECPYCRHRVSGDGPGVARET